MRPSLCVAPCTFPLAFFDSSDACYVHLIPCLLHTPLSLLITYIWNTISSAYYVHVYTHTPSRGYCKCSYPVTYIRPSPAIATYVRTLPYIVTYIHILALLYDYIPLPALQRTFFSLPRYINTVYFTALLHTYLSLHCNVHTFTCIATCINSPALLHSYFSLHCC